MLSSPLPPHGGDLSAADARFGTPPAGWLDLSTGINPFGYPNLAQDPEAFRRLPTAAEGKAFEDAARAYYGVPDEAGLVAVPGTQAALQVTPSLRPASVVAILSPTYSEHGKTWRAVGHEVTDTASFDALEGADVAVLVNPNNPDGARSEPAQIVALAEEVTSRGGWVIVDEAFADTEDGLSVVPDAGRDGIIILRSMGKFFGLAGLRLGCVIGTPDFTDQLRERLGPWAIGGGALEIGARALSDADWIEGMRSRLSQASEELGSILLDAGLTVIGGTDLFTLAETDRASELYETLGRQGILVRAFPDDPTWLRFGLPGEAENVEKLVTAFGTPR